MRLLRTAIARPVVPSTCTTRRLAIPLLRLFLRHVASTASNAFVMTFHAVKPLAGFREDQLVYTLVASPTLKTCGVIGILAGHHGLIENWLVANFAVVTVRADG